MFRAHLAHLDARISFELCLYVAHVERVSARDTTAHKRDERTIAIVSATDARCDFAHLLSEKWIQLKVREFRTMIPTKGAASTQDESWLMNLWTLRMEHQLEFLGQLDRRKMEHR